MVSKAESLEKVISLLILFVCPVWRLDFSSKNEVSVGRKSVVRISDRGEARCGGLKRANP